MTSGETYGTTDCSAKHANLPEIAIRNNADLWRQGLSLRRTFRAISAKVGTGFASEIAPKQRNRAFLVNLFSPEML